VSALPVVVLLLLPSSAGAASSETYRQLNLFGDVFERVRADFVDDVEDKELIESAIDGMLMSLDPHSSYLNPEKYEEMQVQTKGEFGGLGIEVTMENRLVKVVSPIDDTPAHRAGIKAGDVITHIDGKQVLGLTLSEAVERMRGPVGTDIVLTVRREGVDKPLEVTITRAIIKIRSVRSRAEGNAGYIRITSFNEQTVSGVKAAIEDIRNQVGDSMIGLILDLRNNPGGLLDQAVGVSDLFLDKGEIVSTRGRRHDSTQRFNAKPGDLAEGLPVVLLINGGTASASEIVAGALQDHRRAIVLGTKSFGKGSVQTIIPISGRGAIRLTTARYFTPSGYSIQAKGIEPDIIVKQARIETVDEERRRSEATLRNPLDGGGSEPDDPAKTNDRSDTAQQDYQLTRALDLLHGLALFSGEAVN
jgi:carboxyl-terminal processing protease